MNTCSQSAWFRGNYRTAALVVLGVTFALVPRTAHAVCVGDCNGDGQVTVNELITMVNVALGTADVSACTAGDANGDGQITVNEIVSGVNNALNGCPTEGVCGDGKVDAGEECDDGGSCIGGTNAGTPCTAEGDCEGEGVCVGGDRADAVCSADADCPGGACVHCVTFGGDGCAANCTNESEVAITLQPGEIGGDGTELVAGSGFIAQADILTIPIDVTGSVAFTIGHQKDGQIPVVMRATSLQLPAINVMDLACACLRGVSLKTCGGTLFEADGITPATECTTGITAGDAECAGKKPCTYVFGQGNAAVGVVGCSSLDGTDVTLTQDNGGSTLGPVILTRSGTGGPGSAVLRNATSLGFVIGACTGSDPTMFGDDGAFCTDDDPSSARGETGLSTLTTGTSTGTINNANMAPGNDIGPFSTMGAPFSCSDLASGSASGGVLTGAFTVENDQVGDLLVTSVLVAQ
ncbi:MAG: hypothetical protein ACE5I7_09400 [Candidatus Binatia bacterium]